jgi:hypothetical protein
MSRSSQKEIAQYVATLITTAPCVCDRGTQRSPEKVGRLLADHLQDLTLKAALSEMRGKDGHILRALSDLRSSYANNGKVDWGGAEGTWRLVLIYLEGFANQEGGHELCTKQEVSAMLTELASIYRQLAAKEERTKKSA